MPGTPNTTIEAPHVTSNDEYQDDEREKLRLLIEGTERRENLEALRTIYTRRLHRQSDDFDATHGLTLVNAKLRRTSYRPPVVTSAS